MVEEILKRWTDIGKPLFLIPKDLKERILSGMDGEVKLNYLVRMHKLLSQIC